MKNKSISFLKTQTNLIILIFLIIILSSAVPSFRQLSNFLNILKSISLISIISCGLTIVVIGGGLDLSVGSTLSLIGVITVTMLNNHNIVMAIMIPIIAAVIIGIINGVITSYFNISSIIVTLGMLSVISGVALVYVNGGLQSAQSDQVFESIAKVTLFRIPLYCYIFIIIAIILEILLKKSTFGRNLVLIGTNPEAAKIIGINITLIRTLSFVVCSFCVAISAIILSSRLMSATPTAGVGYEFNAVTAIVIGGISLSGGKGNIYNTVIGATLLGVIINALNITNVPFAFQAISKGLLIIIAITLDVRARSGVEKQ